ncbi:MAG: hypothetical protein PVF77_11535 [Anaerolineae bacterium]
MVRTRSALLLMLLAGLALAGLLAISLVVAAQGDGGYDLSWWTVDGGGGTSKSDAFALSGTLGQAEASTWRGGGYTLTGGFWGGEGQASGEKLWIYLPLVVREQP